MSGPHGGMKMTAACWNIEPCILVEDQPGSSVSIVSDYGLDDRAIGVRFLAGAADFSSGQTGSGAPPASYAMGTGGPFPGGKARLGREAGHSSPSSAEVKNELELHFLSPLASAWR
jgi:hypothetical protein